MYVTRMISLSHTHTCTHAHAHTHMHTHTHTQAHTHTHTATKEACSICDELAAKANSETRLEMLQAYSQASRFEWMFWDSAYQPKCWPIALDGTSL